MIDLPESFESRMKKLLGREFPEFVEALNTPPGHTIRINPAKIRKSVDLKAVNYCSTGYCLEQRPIFTLDPTFHSGAYYVQESSSMFLEQFIKILQKPNPKVLDLCAAPGGKSTHLSSMLPAGSLLISNEVIHSRARILSENLKKWGHYEVMVTNNDPGDFSRLPGFFDLIVVDAPCSGEGLFRRDPAAVDEWSESNTTLCAARQKRILADVWSSLAVDGILIYSTCTFNPAENEENIRWLSEFAPVEPVALQIPAEWGIETTDAAGFPCYRFYPHKVEGEGFFIAAVRKKGTTETLANSRSRETMSLASKNEQNTINRVLKPNLPLSLVKFEENFLAWPTAWLSELFLLKTNLRIIHAGVKTGEIIRESFLPAHELAVSVLLDKSTFPEVELSLEQAIAFLKREDFQHPFREKGWNLVHYAGQTLGWAKNIGTRFNNSYPKEWRIRMSTTEFTGEKLALESSKFPIQTNPGLKNQG